MCKTFRIGSLIGAMVLAAALFGATVPAMAKPPLSIYDARQIAFNMGIHQIKKIQLDDGQWQIKGWDQSRHKIKIKVDAYSGAIVEVERN